MRTSLLAGTARTVQVDREEGAVDAGRVIARTELRGRQVVLRVEDRLLAFEWRVERARVVLIALFGDDSIGQIHHVVNEALAPDVIQVLRDPTHTVPVHEAT